MLQLGAPSNGLALPDHARREYWKFIPHDGDGYTAEDKIRCFQQQPILVNGRTDDLPSYLGVFTGGCTELDALPPILRFGWRLEPAKLMDIIRAHFPTHINVAGGSKIMLTEFIDNESNQQKAQIQFDVPSYMGECAMTTIFNFDLMHAVLERLRIPAKYISVLKFCVLTDEYGVPGFGLAMGSNVAGVLWPAAQQRVCELFELDLASAQWYLDRNRWYWKNRAPSRPRVSPANPQCQPSTSVLETSSSVECSVSSSSSLSGQSSSGEGSASSRTTATDL